MKRKRKITKKAPYYEINDVVSSTECTGLVQSIPENEYESASVKQIYDIPLNGKQK